MGSAADDSGVVAIGTVLAGRYRIEGVLGAGGMGRVYRGEHTSMGKPVAVKVLHAALGGNQEAAMRFQREAIASGRLDHPNIVSVMDFGVLDDGCLYLVMEALDGEHLGQRLAREKRLVWSDALLIVRSVLLGLRHAHDRGVVHRDIKPDNIFLATRDGEAIVKVLDFGIAKLYVASSDDPGATRAGITVGTPTYLSPEQATGGAITPASDVYSTSVVLFELLVGRAPFESDEPLTLLTSHVGAEVPTFASLAPDLEVPAAVEQLVRRGLAKIIAERIDSTEYLKTIDEILAAHGVAVAPSSIAARSSSQSMGIPLGPFALSSPPPGRLLGTPYPSALDPSPDFLATPTPFPIASVPPPIATPPPSPPAVVAPPSPPTANRARDKRRRLAIAAILVVAVAAFVLVAHSSPQRTHAIAPPPAARTAPLQPTIPAIDKTTQRDSALRDLQSGATCADRKKAIAKLVELGDTTAVPALKKARTRKTNGCLRAAAADAIKALAGTI